MGSRSIERQSIAIDEVMTTMSQVVLIDNALDYVQSRPLTDIESRTKEISSQVGYLLESVQTPDIDAPLLNNLTDMLARDFREVAPELLARGAVTNYILERRKGVVERQEHFARQLRGKLLNITLHADNIVHRVPWVSPEDTERIYAKYPFPPLKAGDTFEMSAGGPHQDVPSSPKRRRQNDIYDSFHGYSLDGYFKGKGKPNRMPHEVSLVGKQGLPQVSITPR